MEEALAKIGNSGDDGVSARSHQLPAQADVNGGGGSISGGFTEDFHRNSGGKRWPKQETLALIRIRSEMDAAFRDSNLKAPLWDQVSRKLLALEFYRSAKKCREKFENIYKYHRRTKESRTLKSDKIYQFSDQLQALESNHHVAFPHPPTIAVKKRESNFGSKQRDNRTGSGQNNMNPISVAAQGKKRKREDLFEKMMKELIKKQEKLQMKFLDTLDRRERDRVAKEEAWRAREIAKMNQERERLVKERSIIAAKDAAIVTILQKLIGKSVGRVLPSAAPPPVGKISSMAAIIRVLS